MSISEIAIRIIIALILAYLIGSIPPAYIVGRLRKGVDIRQVGSRNMGAMNVFYSVGFWWGIIVLSADILKGVLAVAVARWLGTPVLAQMQPLFLTLVEFFAGVFAIVGHSFPVFLKFRGGRGGASAIGVLVYLMPWGVPIYLGLFLLLMWITRFPTLAYSLAFLMFPFLAWLKYQSAEFVIFSLVILLLPGLRYIPRIKEMHSKSGGWGHFFKRRGLKDRL